mmetsp:Transcript_2024/g.7896  ORF Transcript_2024/g.7896 Transcript_2024/m.7896 type:complete len:260 (+) Transcript_2024:3080-3859(+)
MMRVTGDGSTKILCVDASTTLLCAFQRLHDEDTSTFTHHESISRLVPGSRGPLRIIIVLAESSTSDETTQTNRNDGCFRATGDHDFCIAVPDVIGCRVKGVICRCASGRDRIIRSHKAFFYSEHCTAHVCDGIRNEKWSYLLRPLLHECFHTILENSEATHTAANENTDTLFIEVFECGSIQTCIFQSFVTRHESITKTVVKSSIVFLVDVALAVEIAYLCSEFRWKITRIESIDRRNATLSRKKLIVVCGVVVTKHRT